MIRGVNQSIRRRLGTWATGRLERDHDLQWFLLVGSMEVDGDRPPRPNRLTPLFPPRDRFWADPFLWCRDGRQALFFETYPFATRRGAIAALELDPDGKPIGEETPVLACAHHLSYPFLFEHDGQLYMMPESSEARRLDVWRCVEFPFCWAPAATLMEGVRLVDATLIREGDRWWLFCAMRHGRAKLNQTLCAFHADSPLASSWTPHARNPLLRDFSRARPGGRILRDAGGRLLRPAQNCVPHYGAGIVMNEIRVLDPERFEETPRWGMMARDLDDWYGLHHLDVHGSLIAMDAQRVLSRCPASDAALGDG